jgi:glycosyltransferase involved in cell wall biosynthesis
MNNSRPQLHNGLTGWISPSREVLRKKFNLAICEKAMNRESKKTRICMVGYSRYSTDTRIRREAEALLDNEEYNIVFIGLKEDSMPSKNYILEGVEVVELSCDKYRGKSPIRYLLTYLNFTLRAFFVLSKLFIARGFDAIHFHNMPDFVVFAAVLPRLLGRPVVLDIHDSMPETFSGKFPTLFGRAFFRAMCAEEKLCSLFATKIICVNHPQKEILVNRGIPSDKIIVLMNVPDDKRFTRYGTATRHDTTKFRLVYHGTIAHRLGVDLIIRAVAKLRDSIPGLEFHIVGNGDDEQSCIRLVNEMGLEQHVFFRGPIPLDNLPSLLLREMDLGVIGNRQSVATDLMLPVKMIECIALGIPVVVPKLQTINYYFTEKMVKYFMPEDVDSLASAIIDLYRKPSERHSQAASALKFLDTYGWERHKRNLLDYYQQIRKEG